MSSSNIGRQQTSHPPLEKNTSFAALYQILLRAVAFVAASAAAIFTYTSSETILLFGYTLHAKYTYSPAFIFFFIGNAVAAAYSLLSMPLVWIARRGRSNNDINSYLIYVLDVLMTEVMIAATAAALGVAYIGQYGNSHTGWPAICDHFHGYCGRVQMALIAALISIIPFFIIVIAYPKPT